MRIPGLAGRVVAKLGVIPQQIAPGEIYPALERGTIDAAEWAASHDDERLGFVKVAPYYYSPGWWEPNAMTHLFVNLGAWNALPAHYKAIVRSAAEAVNQTVIANYDVVNPLAMRRLMASGAQLRFFSAEIMNAAYDASFALYDEIAKENPRFATDLRPLEEIPGRERALHARRRQLLRELHLEQALQGLKHRDWLAPRSAHARGRTGRCPAAHAQAPRPAVSDCKNRGAIAR